MKKSFSNYQRRNKGKCPAEKKQRAQNHWANDLEN